MPKINKFEIKNFKGIEKTTIALSDRSNTPIITLIGLNESGKTTILEALSHFVSSDKIISSLFQTKKTSPSTTGIIPISKRAAFSEKITIKAEVELDASDIAEIQSAAHDQDLEIDKAKLEKKFYVTKELSYKDSALSKDSSRWSIDLWTRKKGEVEFSECKPDPQGNSFWNTTADLIELRLPSIAYFPTFLVEIPNKIYLKEHSGETLVNQHYRLILASIMEGIGDGLSIEKHITDRIESYSKARPNSNWLSQFRESQQRVMIDSVFLKISNAVSKEVIGGWKRVFSKESTAKSISVDWDIDTNKESIPYASFRVSDGENKYEISERSLGFRWFFSFLLFTAFKGSTVKPQILIFDEPAANLHAKAQAELLKSFERIAADGTKIIYSTHSHHMINPKWLNGAYIVENTALNLESDDSFEFHTTPANIKAIKYREFISSYPTRSSYFQPVIESLEYITPEIIGTPPFVLVEGISDFYALLISQKISKTKLNYRLLPGVGSGASGPIVSLMLGRGEKFIILLDDDAAGKKECIRYKEGWHLSDRHVLTLGKIDNSFSGAALEKLIDNETIDTIKDHFKITTPPSKKQIGWYLAEACASIETTPTPLSDETLKNLVKVLESLNSAIENI